MKPEGVEGSFEDSTTSSASGGEVRSACEVWVLKKCTTKAHFESLSRLKGWVAEVNLMIRYE